MTDLYKEMKKLEEIIIKSEKGFVSGSWFCKLLNNHSTAQDCQVVEAVDYDGQQIPFPQHRHANSKEIFYQVRGATVFSDGTVLKTGETKVINPGEIHSASISPNGACIIILQPIEVAFA